MKKSRFHTRLYAATAAATTTTSVALDQSYMQHFIEAFFRSIFLSPIVFSVINKMEAFPKSSQKVFVVLIASNMAL